MYSVENCNYSDINRLIEYKKDSIFKYSNNISEEEKNKINNYITNSINNNYKDYYNIIVNNKIIGSYLLTDTDKGKLLDEIYIEEEYRNKGIGTNVIKDILSNNKVVYLWVYKDNKKAISLYEKLGFIIDLETENRYYMKCGE